MPLDAYMIGSMGHHLERPNKPFASKMENTNEVKWIEQQVEKVERGPDSGAVPVSEGKIMKNGIVLVPQPTNDPEDPLVNEYPFDCSYECVRLRS